MKSLIIILKTYHIAIILMFFLPFMHIGCWGPSAAEIAEKARLDSLKADSILKVKTIANLDSTAASKMNLDSLVKEYDNSASIKDSVYDTQTNSDVITTDSIVSVDTLSHLTNSKSEESKFVDDLPEIHGFLFTDGNNNYTGFGIVVLYSVLYLKSCSLINAFLLIIVSSIMAFRKKWRFYKSILIIDGFGLIFLIFSEANLWGYWVCLFSWIGLIIFDIILIKRQNISTLTISADKQKETIKIVKTE